VSICDDIFSLYERGGAAAYFGERVSMTEHALQTAYFAQLSKASPPLVVAALLHDIGHLLEAVPDDLAEWTQDARHEEIGARWLAKHFPASVSEPVRLHVPAKRYLCATDKDYSGKLSSASVHTLKLQGGPMSPAEVGQFETHEHFRDALALRRWDDQGKVQGLKTPPLRDYRALIEEVSR